MLLHSPSVIFVLGCQRSGTTLLNHVIGSHPDVQMLDHDIYRREGKGRKALLDDILGHFDSQYCCVKGPQLVYNRDWINAEFCDPKVIWIFRDPLETVSSMLNLRLTDCIDGKYVEMPWLHFYRQEGDAVGETDAEKCMNIWLAKNQAGLSYDDACFIHYRDLCYQPEKMIRRLCDRVGLPFHEQMLSHNEVKTVGEPVGKYNPSLAIHKNEKHIDESLESITPHTDDLYQKLLGHKNRIH